ncbi:hypothetical protein PGTUg99_036624 [Puccinia graminis f. sp. tritici]|uniref:Uncharacterized protein n=1 Tax=Puccinia graminis f. sp. tritici TaxID=56615 RepID=A0A5B0RHQ1_PUCGR|nr:hypothetical protein PGTUg99_036624 [Puccinia graminis f. sp. tritici]
MAEEDQGPHEPQLGELVMRQDDQWGGRLLAMRFDLWSLKCMRVTRSELLEWTDQSFPLCQQGDEDSGDLGDLKRGCQCGSTRSGQQQVCRAGVSERSIRV